MLLAEHMAGIRRCGSRSRSRHSCCTHCRVACCKKVKPQRKWGQDAPRSVLITICYETCAPRRKRRESEWGGEERAHVNCQSVAGRGWAWGWGWGWGAAPAAEGNSALMMMLSDLHRLPACLDSTRLSPRQQLVAPLQALFTFPKWKVFSLLPLCLLIWPTTATDATIQNKYNFCFFRLFFFSSCFLIENEN